MRASAPRGPEASHVEPLTMAAKRDACGRCGREFEQVGDDWREVSNVLGAGPCAGCNGGGYVPPKVAARSRDCPTCGRVGTLTAREAAKGYHCSDCTAAAEFGA